MSHHICFIDFETTGIDLVNDHPIQLGASLADARTGKELAKFSSLIRPGPKCKPWGPDNRAYQIHGISYEKAMDEGLDPYWVVFNFSQWSRDYTFSFGAWNACFDVQFFRRMCYETGFEKWMMDSVYYRHFDLQSFVRGLNMVSMLKGVKSLDDLRKLYNIERKDDHDAYEDANITRQCHNELTKHLARRFIIPAALA